MVKHIAVLTLLFIGLIPCLASAFKLPDSDQTKCYQAVSPYAEIPCADTGQDGAYRINPKSYTDHGDGTVTDNNTGLMWQKCSVGQNNDSTCSGSASTYNWYPASGTHDATYNPSSESVCGALTLGNHNDWRLPSKKELMSIVEYSIPGPGPAIKTAFFPNTDAACYWLSTTYAGDPVSAFLVNFYDGYVTYGYKSGIGRVRCVRGGQ